MYEKNAYRNVFFFVGLVNTVTMSACVGHLCVKIQQGTTLLNSAVCSVPYASTTSISALVVAAMNSCFDHVKIHQYGIAPGYRIIQINSL